MIAAGTDRGQKDPELEKMDYLVEGVHRSHFVTADAAHPWRRPCSCSGR